MPRAALLFSALLAGATALAQVTPAQRFDRGVRLSAEGDHRGAMVEFRAAYEATQNPEVLFNIAAVHEQLNEYVEAEEVIERYQRLAPPSSVARHRAEVVAALARLHSRIGGLRVRSETPGVACSVDGRAVADLSRPLRLSVGPHALRCEAPGHEPLTLTVETRGEALGEVTAALRPRSATLTVAYPLRGAEVRVDGRAVGRTPLRDPVEVAEGRHRVELRHPGYETVVAEVDARGVGARVEAVPRWLDPVPRDEGASIEVRASEPGAVSTLDGRRINPDGSTVVPMGAHRLRVARESFEPVEQDLELTAGERRRVELRLLPTAEFRERYLGAARTRRRVWVGVGLAGIAATVAGAVWLGLALPSWLDADERYETHRRAFTECGLTGCAQGATYHATQRDLAADDTRGLLPQVAAGGALLGVGVAALVTAAVIAASAPALDRFDRAPRWHIGLGGAAGGVRVGF